MPLRRRLAACLRPASIALFVACAPSGDPDDRPDETGAPEADGDTSAEADTGTDSGTGADTGTDSGTDTDTDTAPPGPAPSAGDLTPTATVTIPQYAKASAALDLDGDGLDEVLVEDWLSERLYIGRIDARAGTGTLEAVPGLTDVDRAFSLGNAQVVIQRIDGSALVTLTREADATWSAVSTELPGKATWAGPVGDLDGDGVTDAVIRIDTDTYVMRGPVDPALPEGGRILDLPSYEADHESCNRTEAFASADVDGDGADDLVTLAEDSGNLEIVYGPVTVGTVGRLEDLAQTVVPLGLVLNGCGVGVIDDLDGDGAREVVVGAFDALVIYDDLPPGTTAAEPERVVESGGAEIVAPGLAPALSGVGDEAGWWYTLPDPADFRPDAAIAVYNDDNVVYGRFGSADAIDVAWTGQLSLYAVLGFEAPPGDDLDRDGWPAAEDCDDADPTRRPEAPDFVDGVDQDCDGAVDEAPATPLVPVLAWSGTDLHHQFGRYMAAWGPSHAAAQGASGRDLVVLDLVSGAATPLDLPVLTAHATPYAAGDVDGDGHADLGVYGSASGGAYGDGLAYGPVDAAEGVSFTVSLDGHEAGVGVGDLDGDGYGELVVTGGYYTSSEYRYRAVLVAGQAARDGAFDLTRLDDALGSNVAAGPVDLDGDGYDDLLLAGYDSVRFWLGPLAADLVPSADNASGAFTGFEAGPDVTTGDVDGDAAADLVLAFPLADRVDVVFGPWSAGTWDLTTPDLTYTGPAGSGFGGAVAWEAGEWLFVGAPGVDRLAGGAYGFPLDTPTSADSDHAALRVDGAHPGAYAGAALLLRDPDADGVLDLLVGATGEAAPLQDEGTLRTYPLPAR